MNSAGNLVWFHQTRPGDNAGDLRTQVFHRKNNLTWRHGRTIMLGYRLGEDVIADANYRAVAVVRAGSGLRADEHEFNVTPQGTAYILAYSPVKSSLASACGPSSGTVVDGVIQEIDVHTGLMWEWHSPSQPSVVSTTPRKGFETAIAAPAAAFYEVRALSASGRVLSTSKVVAPLSG